MPYISAGARNRLDPLIGQLIALIDDPPGEINYVIQQLLFECVGTHGFGSYAALATAQGVLDTAAREFYRRVVVPFEEVAIARNGDIFPTPARVSGVPLPTPRE